MKHCIKCSAEFKLENYCPFCGGTLKSGILPGKETGGPAQNCGKCGRVFRNDEKFCGSCGTDFAVAVSMPYISFRPEDASVDGM